MGAQLPFIESIVFATDMDEVLLPLGGPWLEKAMACPKVGAALRDSGLRSPGALPEGWSNWGRPHYKVEKELVRLCGGEGEPSDDVREAVMDLYTKGDFYRDVPPSNLIDGVLGIAAQDKCSKVFVVTHTLDGTHASKANWVRRHLNHPKVELLLVPKEIDKGKAMESQEISWSTFIDDNPKILREVMQHPWGGLKEYLIPTAGWNVEDAESLAALAASRGSSLAYCTGVVSQDSRY